MYRYKLTYKNQKTVEANGTNPIEAFCSVYHNVKLIPVKEKRNANVCIELLNGKRSSCSYYSTDVKAKKQKALKSEFAIVMYGPYDIKMFTSGCATHFCNDDNYAKENECFILIIGTEAFQICPTPLKVYQVKDRFLTCMAQLKDTFIEFDVPYFTECKYTPIHYTLSTDIASDSINVKSDNGNSYKLNCSLRNVVFGYIHEFKNMFYVNRDAITRERVENVTNLVLKVCQNFDIPITQSLILNMIESIKYDLSLTTDCNALIQNVLDAHGIHPVPYTVSFNQWKKQSKITMRNKRLTEEKLYSIYVEWAEDNMKW